MKIMTPGEDVFATTASIGEIINEARNGRMFILMDDEQRENEGDLIIPAQMATPEAINFMVTHGRGLVCLALTRSRVEQLDLALMSADNRTMHETAFTISIEAREGLTTGISAADRARTIAVAIDSAKGSETIVSPGHIFPLVARDGGVLVRAGHTEAAVDISRLAGLNASGVICEIMNDDGTMARRDDLAVFGRTHGLKIGTIRDLIAYRRRYDHLLERRAEIEFTSLWGGKWRAITFLNKLTGEELVALVKGTIQTGLPTLVRMHTMSVFIDVFSEDTPRNGLLGRAMQAIAEEGAGVVVLINKPVQDLTSRFMNLRRQGKGLGTPELEELRDYGSGAQILTDLGVHDMILLTNTHYAMIGLAGYGLSIVGERSV